jgi:hypothetical protein
MKREINSDSCAEVGKNALRNFIMFLEKITEISPASGVGVGAEYGRNGIAEPSCNSGIWYLAAPKEIKQSNTSRWAGSKTWCGAFERKACTCDPVTLLATRRLSVRLCPTSPDWIEIKSNVMDATV